MVEKLPFSPSFHHWQRTWSQTADIGHFSVLILSINLHETTKSGRSIIVWKLYLLKLPRYQSPKLKRVHGMAICMPLFLLTAIGNSRIRYVWNDCIAGAVYDMVECLFLWHISKLFTPLLMPSYKWPGTKLWIQGVMCFRYREMFITSQETRSTCEDFVSLEENGGRFHELLGRKPGYERNRWHRRS
jgi:hypothetical protein